MNNSIVKLNTGNTYSKNYRVVNCNVQSDFGEKLFKETTKKGTSKEDSKDNYNCISAKTNVYEASSTYSKFNRKMNIGLPVESENYKDIVPMQPNMVLDDASFNQVLKKISEQGKHQGIDDEKFWIKIKELEDKGSGIKSESEIDSNIIVKADGSRVLVLTIKIGGMESTMSIEICKPTELINEQNKDNELNQDNPSENIANSENMLITE